MTDSAPLWKDRLSWLVPRSPLSLSGVGFNRRRASCASSRSNGYSFPRYAKRLIRRSCSTRRHPEQHSATCRAACRPATASSLFQSRRAAASNVDTSSQFAVRCLMPCAPGCRGLLDFDRDRQQLSSGFTVIAARFAEQQCRNGRNNANCRHMTRIARRLNIYPVPKTATYLA